jgi:chaperonin GroEL (HSP60 family)
VKAVGGEASDSHLVNGIVIDKEKCHSSMPVGIGDGTILLIDFPLEVKTTEMDANIQITDPNQITAFLEQEESYIREMVEKVVGSGASAIVCQKGIDDLAKHYLSKAGVFALEKVKKSDMDALSRSTGAAIISNFDDIGSSLGAFAGLEEEKIGELPMTFVRVDNSPSITLLLRGGTAPFIEEIERAFDDAVGVVAVAYEDQMVLSGGGSSFMCLSRNIHEQAKNESGRQRMGMEAFADALEVIPRTLAENAGLDPVDEMMAMRATHDSGKTTYGINIEAGGTINMEDLGVWEPHRVVAQALKSAIETSIMILRIDDVISSRKTGQ